MHAGCTNKGLTCFARQNLIQGFFFRRPPSPCCIRGVIGLKGLVSSRLPVFKARRSTSSSAAGGGGGRSDGGVIGGGGAEPSMAAALWASADAGEWQAQLTGYTGVVEHKGKEGLVELDRWFQNELPGALKGRQPLQLSKDELVKLVDWKLKRGKWRPNLLKYVQELPAGSAEAATRAAFDVLSKHRGGGGPQGKGGEGQGAAAAQQPPAGVVKQALAAVTVLKGVGPATGSAILQAADPSIVFTSDEAMQAALGSKDYTVSKVLQLLEALRSKAAQLSEGADRQWTAQEVELCLWAAANQGGGGAAGPAARGKRKR